MINSIIILKKNRLTTRKCICSVCLWLYGKYQYDNCFLCGRITLSSFSIHVITQPVRVYNHMNRTDPPWWQVVCSLRENLSTMLPAWASRNTVIYYTQEFTHTTKSHNKHITSHNNQEFINLAMLPIFHSCGPATISLNYSDITSCKKFVLEHFAPMRLRTSAEYRGETRACPVPVSRSQFRSFVFRKCNITR